MPSERTGYAPWSLTREAGVQSATVDGTIKVPQNIQPVLSTGFVDEKGDWKGVKSSDETFTIDETHPAVGNGATVLSPQRADHDFINMTGFQDITIAFKVSNGGNYAIDAVMGPDTNPYANLTPVNAAATLQGAVDDVDSSGGIIPLFSQSSEALTADVWNIFMIGSRLRNQKLLQFKITNNSGGNSDVAFAYLRIV